MAYVLKMNSSKPPGTEWASAAMADINKRYWQWVKQYPGVLSVANNFVQDSDHNEKIIIFKDKETYDSWLVDRSQNPDFIARLEHQSEFNHQVTIETYEA